MSYVPIFRDWEIWNIIQLKKIKENVSDWFI